VLKELRKCFEYWMPMDQRHTFVLHLSNHLSFMIFAHAGLFPEKYWPEKISFHGLVLSEGFKMSKSKGNIITLLQVKENYGADVFRFYMTHSTNIEGTFDWRETEAKNARNNLEKLFLYLCEAVKKKRIGKVRDLYLSKWNRIIKEATEKIHTMKLREYNSLVVFEMIKLVNNARFVMDERELNAFYHLLVEDWIKLISPMCPHMAEELWKKLRKKGFVSIVQWPEWNENKINEKVEEEEKYIENLIEDINHIIKIIKEKGKDVSKVFVYVLPKEKENYFTYVNLIRKKTMRKIKIFAVNEKGKYDPLNKSLKAQPGKPALYLE